MCQMNPQTAEVSVAEADDRPPFDLNLAVLLAGFAFEAYSSPPDNVGTPHLDVAECQTVFLSEFFVREIYDGQLSVKVKKVSHLPIMDPWANIEYSEDGYQGDVIGEYTPDLIGSEFLKGEKQLIEKILQAEINMFRSILDGTALMQHMEDFYYITLLECVKSNYNPVLVTNSNKAEMEIN